jgi:hypothetical protein
MSGVADGADRRVLTSVAGPPGASLAHVAAWQGHMSVLQVLVTLGADVNRPAEDGATALYVAAGAGHIGVVRTLLKVGAEPALVKQGGLSPLWHATVNNHPTVIHALLQHGIDRIAQAQVERAPAVSQAVTALRDLEQECHRYREARVKAATAAATCESIREELRELREDMAADLDDANRYDSAQLLLTNKASAQRRLKSAGIAVLATTSDVEERGARRGGSSSPQRSHRRRRGRSPDPAERRSPPIKRTAKQVRARWRASATLASEISRRARSPDPWVKADARWSAAASATARRHYNVWSCGECGRRQILRQHETCPGCKAPNPEATVAEAAKDAPCKDFDAWVCVVDPSSGQPYWANTQTRESQWTPPLGWEQERRRRMFDEWEQHMDEASGHAYYVSNRTRQSQWLAPDGWEDERVRRQDAAQTATVRRLRKEALGPGTELAVRSESGGMPAPLPRPTISKAQIDWLHQKFDALDANSDGQLSCDELSVALRHDVQLAQLLGVSEVSSSESGLLVVCTTC